MAEITIAVHGRRYAIACDDGQEGHVFRLAQELDRRAGAMAAGLGQIGEARLLVLVALVLADELGEARTTSTPAGEEVGATELSTRPSALLDPEPGAPGREAHLRALAHRVATVARLLGEGENDDRG